MGYRGNLTTQGGTDHATRSGFHPKKSAGSSFQSSQRAHLHAITQTTAPEQLSVQRPPQRRTEASTRIRSSILLPKRSIFTLPRTLFLIRRTNRIQTACFRNGSSNTVGSIPKALQVLHRLSLSEFSTIDQPQP